MKNARTYLVRLAVLGFFAYILAPSLSLAAGPSVITPLDSLSYYLIMMGWGGIVGITWAIFFSFVKF